MAAAQLVLMMYCDEVRRLLLKYTGYECAVRCAAVAIMLPDSCDWL